MSKLERMMWMGHDCIKLVLKDAQGVEYTLAIPGWSGEITSQVVGWITNVNRDTFELRPKKEPISEAIRELLKGGHPDWVITSRSYAENLAKELGVKISDLNIKPFTFEDEENENT